MALPAGAFTYEFLYRNRGDGTPPDYHLIAGLAGADGFGAPTLSLSDPMTPDQAAAQGLTLPDAISGINLALTAEIAVLQSQLADLKSQLTALKPPTLG